MQSICGQNLIVALKSNQRNGRDPPRSRMRIHIELERKYPSKFKNMHTQLPPSGQGISGNWMLVEESS